MAATKEQMIEAARWCEQAAQEALSRGLDFAVLAGGASSDVPDFEKAGALASAAGLLRARAENPDGQA